MIRSVNYDVGDDDVDNDNYDHDDDDDDDNGGDVVQVVMLFRWW